MQLFRYAILRCAFAIVATATVTASPVAADADGGLRGSPASMQRQYGVALENGVVVQVPPFVTEGEEIIVDPTENRYIERRAWRNAIDGHGGRGGSAHGGYPLAGHEACERAALLVDGCQYSRLCGLPDERRIPKNSPAFSLLLS